MDGARVGSPWKRIAVTGATGMVGLALVDALLTDSCEVVAVVRPGTPKARLLPASSRLRVVECPISGYRGLPEAVGAGIDAMVHLAWDGTRGPLRLDWGRQSACALHALAAAEAARELGVKAFVGIGSQAEYGRADSTLSPSTPLRPESAYGASKVAACALTESYCKSVGIRHSWGRIVSAFGAHDDASSLVMSLIRAFSLGERPSCTPCEQIWDYVYVKDVAEAISRIAFAGKDGARYVIASGNSRPLKEFVREIRDVVAPGSEIGFGEIPYYPDQAMRLEADISSLTRDTGFVPGYTFEEGIRETLDWFRRDAAES